MSAVIITNKMLKDIDKRVKGLKSEKPFRLCTSILNLNFKRYENSGDYISVTKRNYWYREITSDMSNFHRVFNGLYNLKGTKTFIYWPEDDPGEVIEFEIPEYPAKEFYTVKVLNRFSAVMENEL